MKLFPDVAMETIACCKYVVVLAKFCFTSFSTTLAIQWWTALLRRPTIGVWRWPDESRIAREELLTYCDPVPFDEEG